MVATSNVPYVRLKALLRLVRSAIGGRDAAFRVVSSSAQGSSSVQLQDPGTVTATPDLHPSAGARGVGRFFRFLPWLPREEGSVELGFPFSNEIIGVQARPVRRARYSAIAGNLRAHA